jgi:hypothetical protein
MSNPSLLASSSLVSAVRAAAAAAVLAASAIAVPAAVQAAPTYTGEVVVPNLLNPRGLTVDAMGRILFSQAGQGGDMCDVPNTASGPVTSTRCWGKTGAIGRYDPVSQSSTLLWTNLDSIAKTNNPSDLSPVAGLQDLAIDGHGRLLGVFGYRGEPATRPVGSLFARLVSFDLANPGASPVTLADFGDYETANPSHTPPFSNPFSLVWHGGNSYVTDAGANRLLKVADHSSVVELLENFPPVPMSALPPLPPSYPAEAVPTGLTVSATGKLYNTQLPGFPFVPGKASLFSSNGMAGSAMEISSGYSNVMDLSQGPDDWLYMVQYAQLFTNPVGSGSLLRYNPFTDVREVLAEGIDRPTGVLALPDGTVYVTTGGSTTSGALVRYTPGPLPIAGAVLAWQQARSLRRRVRGGARAGARQA